VILGVSEGLDGAVYILALQPYTVLRVDGKQARPDVRFGVDG
jgi:hypothetical protein